MEIVDPIEQRRTALANVVGDTQALQVRLKQPWIGVHHLRQRQPFGQVERRLQQHLRNVPDHVRASTLDHSPQHIVWRQFAVHRIETAQRQELLALECQRTPHVGIAAHQVQVEVWLECRLGRLP